MEILEMQKLDTLNEAGKYDEIIELCNEILCFNIADTDAYAYKASAYLGLRKWEDARKPVEYALKIGGDEGWLRYLLGCIDLETGRFKAAASNFKRSLAVRDHPDPKIGLAQAYIRLGRESEALKLIREDPMALHNLTNWSHGTKH